MDSSSNDSTIRCSVGKWYYKRMLLMTLLLTAGGLWFLYDGVVGYGKKNVVALAQRAFAAGGADIPWARFEADSAELKESAPDGEALETIRAAHAAGSQKTPWSDHAMRNKYSADGSAEPDIYEAFKSGGVIGADWQDYASLRGFPVDPKDDKQVAIKRAYETAGAKREWATFALTKNWSSGEIKYHDKGQIFEQKLIAGLLLCGALAVVVTFLRNRNGTISADADSFTDEKGNRIAFADVFRIDKRKWDNKGLAYAYHRSDGSEKKAVIDDLKFIGAGEILSRMMENFQGELIERVADDEEESESGNGAEAEDPENPANSLADSAEDTAEHEEKS